MNDVTAGRFRGPASPCAAAAPAFVGRQREMAALDAGLAQATSGRGRLVFLTGESGIGKTRIAEEFTAVAQAAGVAALWGRCQEGAGAPSYWPWIQVIRAYAHAAERDTLHAVLGTGAADVAHLVPAIRERLPELPGCPALEPDEARFRVFDSVTTLFVRATERAPLLVVLDDLHCADHPSLLLLDFVARAARHARLLIVATYRDAESRRDPAIGRLLADVARAGERLTVTGLGMEDVARLAEAAVGGPPRGELVAAIHQVTDGNPLFVDEVLRLLLAEGRPEGVREVEAGALRIPDQVRETIRRRLEPLPHSVRSVLGIAAVVGREFDLAVVGMVSGTDRRALLDALDAAISHGVLGEGPAGALRRRFAHVLFRDALYEDMPAADRADLHRRVGEALEILHAGDLEPRLSELAHHFSQAAAVGDPDKALTYTVRAGRQAIALLAYEDAVRHFERGLELLDLGRRPDAALRCELTLALGEALMSAGDTPRARATLRRAAEMARVQAAPETLARAALGFGGPGSVERVGIVDEFLIGLLDEAAFRLADTESALRARVLSRLASALYWSDQQRRSAPLSRQAAEMARRLGDPVALAHTLHDLHWCVWEPGNAEARVAIADEIIALAEQIGAREMVLVGRGWRIIDLIEMGRISAVGAELDGYVEHAGALSYPRFRWWAVLLRAMQALLVGRFDDGRRLAEEALATGQTLQASDAAQAFAVQMLTLGREEGRQAELVGMSEALATQHRALVGWRAAHALLLAEVGDVADARHELERFGVHGFADLPRDMTWMAVMAMLAETAALVGDALRAGAIYDLLAPYADRCVSPRGITCWGSAARYLGLLAATMCRFDDAGRHFERALGTNRRIGARPYLAHTQHEYARVLLTRERADDAARAGELVREARAAARALGMATLLGRLEELDERPSRTATPSTAVLRKEGDYWTVGFGGEAERLRDAKGLHYLAYLVSHPGEQVHALDLAGDIDAGDAGVALDAEARHAYADRLRALREDLEQARRFNDLGRRARLEEEITFLSDELARAVGLGGYERRVASGAERARVNVTRAIRTTIARIAGRNPAFRRYLETTIRTGLFCSYTPDPRFPLSWVL